jgi:tryptophanase
VQALNLEKNRQSEYSQTTINKTKKEQEKSCDAYSMAAFIDGKATIVRAVKLTLPNPIPCLPSCHTPMSK